MILSRVIEHVKAQNWFAVFLDFLIVVAGILIAFQINNWNERRAEHARATGYLERLDADLVADIDNFGKRMEFWKQVSDYGYAAINYADKGDMDGKTYWQLLVAFFQASQIDNFNVTRPTYDELTNAGELGLIGDVSLRNALSLYYANASFQALSESPDYRVHVRGAIPTDIQAYIWDDCFNSDSYYGQSMFDCDAPVSEEQAKELVDVLAGDAAMMAELRYYLSTLHVANFISDDRIEQAQDLRNAIAAALGSPHETTVPLGDEDKEVVETPL